MPPRRRPSPSSRRRIRPLRRWAPGFPPFGADAVRFTLATYPPSNKRIALAPKRIEGNRHFLNKIWNAARLALDVLGDFAWPTDAQAHVRPTGFFNRWIRSRFAATCEAGQDGMEGFASTRPPSRHTGSSGTSSATGTWTITSPSSAHDGAGASVAETRETLAYVLEGSLRSMHPPTPFVTEELLAAAPRPPSRGASIALGPYRSRSPKLRLATSRPKPGWISAQGGRLGGPDHPKRARYRQEGRSDDARTRRKPRSSGFSLGQNLEGIRLLVKTRGYLLLQPLGAPREPGTTLSVLSSAHGPIEVLVVLRALVDRAHEAARVDREVKKIERDLVALEKKLASPGFADRAPKGARRRGSCAASHAHGSQAAARSGPKAPRRTVTALVRIAQVAIRRARQRLAG